MDRIERSYPKGQIAAAKSNMSLPATMRLANLQFPKGGVETEVPSGQRDVHDAVVDEALISLISEGHQEALASLFRRYARPVRIVALRVLKDSAEAEDLLQDIFILIHRLSRTFDSSKTSAQFWILQMTYRRAISRRRYLNSRRYYAQVELDEAALPNFDLRSVHSEGSIDQRLAELDLEKMFGTLSEDQQKTLRLHFIEGYPLDEIATMLGQTKRNIRNHSFRGLERLRKLIFTGKLPGARAV